MRKTILAALLVLVLALIAGCGDDSDAEQAAGDSGATMEQSDTMATDSTDPAMEEDAESMTDDSESMTDDAESMTDDSMEKDDAMKDDAMEKRDSMKADGNAMEKGDG